jgi:hypothetical protein
VAKLYTRRGEYQKALGYGHKALETAMYNSEANYIYGVISRRLGNLVDAKETLGFKPQKTSLSAPAIEEFQPEATFKPTDKIPVEPGKGWLLILSEMKSQ